MIGLIHKFFKGLAILGAVSFGFAALATVADIVLRITGVGLRGVVDYVQLFVAMGVFAANAGLSRSLFDAVNLVVGRYRGGPAMPKASAPRQLPQRVRWGF
jgi:TRAP-type uncharacterized transport system fused permease subunit